MRVNTVPHPAGRRAAAAFTVAALTAAVGAVTTFLLVRVDLVVLAVFAAAVALAVVVPVAEYAVRHRAVARVVARAQQQRAADVDLLRLAEVTGVVATCVQRSAA